MKTRNLLGIFCFFASCASNLNDNNNCFYSQIGRYKFDKEKTLKESGSLGKFSNDHFLLDSFEIVFKSDSTFYMNRKVSFFTDTIGKWNSGDCNGFENSAILSYYSSKAVEQFGVCHPSDSFMTRLAPHNEKYGSIGLWFKKL